MNTSSASLVKTVLVHLTYFCCISAGGPVALSCTHCKYNLIHCLMIFLDFLIQFLVNDKRPSKAKQNYDPGKI